MGMTLRNIKMIGIDLDGTLLTDKKEIRPYTREVLRRATDKGIIVFAATGRAWSGMPEEIRTFPGMRYALTLNGARLYDRDGDKVLEERLLLPKLAKKALEICGKYDTLQEVYFDGYGYSQAEQFYNLERYHKDPNMWDYYRSTRIPVADVLAMIEKEDRGLDKAQALFADMEERAQAFEELSGMEGIVIAGSLKYNIEINAAGVDKGSALLTLGRLLGVDREEIMACGDGDNDISMLQAAGLGVAMGNAPASVKASADYVTGTNEEEGVAQAIERFVLGGETLC